MQRFAGVKVRTQPVLAAGGQRQTHRGACLADPQFRGIHPVPVAALAGAQQEQDGGTGAPFPVRLDIAPGFPVVPALGVRLQTQRLNHGAGVEVGVPQIDHSRGAVSAIAGSAENAAYQAASFGCPTRQGSDP